MVDKVQDDKVLCICEDILEQKATFWSERDHVLLTLLGHV